VTLATSGPGTVTFPPFDWIPNVDQFSETGSGLLVAVGAALDHNGVGGDFGRRVFTHGTVVPLQVNDVPQSQLIVTLVKIQLGRAGAYQYQYEDGALGKYAYIVGEYEVQLWTPWPTPSGGLSASLADDADVMAGAIMLSQVMLIAMATLRALALGGVTTNPPILPERENKMLVGPAVPAEPAGGLAGWKIAVEAEVGP
jgi:hypothetical protein